MPNVVAAIYPSNHHHSSPTTTASTTAIGGKSANQGQRAAAGKAMDDEKFPSSSSSTSNGCESNRTCDCCAGRDGGKEKRWKQKQKKNWKFILKISEKNGEKKSFDKIACFMKNEKLEKIPLIFTFKSLAYFHFQPMLLLLASAARHGTTTTKRRPTTTTTNAQSSAAAASLATAPAVAHRRWPTAALVWRIHAEFARWPPHGVPDRSGAVDRLPWVRLPLAGGVDRPGRESAVHAAWGAQLAGGTRVCGGEFFFLWRIFFLIFFWILI